MENTPINMLHRRLSGVSQLTKTKERRKAMLKKIGVLWKGEDKNGQAFLSGTLDMGVLGKVNLMVFKNKYQDKEKNQPEYIINMDDGSQQDTSVPI